MGIENTKSPPDQTKERLLKTAESLFATKGYYAVSVREITQAAECNLAAVNYHFGNKQNLYLAVFRHCFIPRGKKIHRCFTNAMAPLDSPSTADIIKALAGAFLEGPITEKERFHHSQLISREMAAPTAAFNILMEQAFRPLFNDLLNYLRTALPEIKNEEMMLLNIFSIFSMILHFSFARPLISSITGQNYDKDFKTKLINHITDFALHGLYGRRGFNAPRTQGPE